MQASDVMNPIKLYLLIGLAGAIGALSRYGLTQLMSWWLGRGFPYGTLMVNVLGSLLLGMIYAGLQQQLLTEQWRLILGIGFLGALTTFSSFSLDTLLLIQQQQWLKAGLNIGLNLLLSLVAVFLGYRLLSR